MKKLILTFLLSASAGIYNAQVSVCLGSDVTICQGQTVTITECSTGPVTPSGIIMNAPTNVNLTDDAWSQAIDIGFSFSFYGVTHTQCLIGSNGIVSFNLTNAGGFCQWSLPVGVQLPDPSLAPARDAAMPIYQDMNPVTLGSGPIQYQTIGTAPNRKFVVFYNGIKLFGCQADCSTTGIVFYETTNIIEVFTGHKGSCGTWNNNLAIQGTENVLGDLAHITPGRNNTVWNAEMDAKRWTPTAPNNTGSYTISTIPFQTISSTSTVGGGLVWANTLGMSYPYNGGTLNVTLVPPGTTGYFLSGTSCTGAAVGGLGDTTFITRISVNATATATADNCSSGQGTATATPSQGTAPFTFLWSPGGQTTPTATGLVAGPYTVAVTDANGCTRNVSVTVPNNVTTASATSTLVSCPGGSDGTATATMTPATGTITYLWDNGQTTQTATGLSAGTYNCTITSSTGCVNTVSVTVSEIPAMLAPVTTQQDVTCNSGNDGIIAVTVSEGTAPYTYSWDNSASTANVANDLAVGTHIVTITDANGCITTQTATLAQPQPLSITYITPDTVICPEASINISVVASGGSSPYIYTWTSNGSPVGTGSTITVDPATSGTQYCVELSEACGSPTTSACLNITFPTEIVPAIVPDTTADCQPALISFTNTSNNPTEIATTVFEFGDGNSRTANGTESVSNTFVNAQQYTVNVTIVSVYGCITTKSFPNIVTANPVPVAGFNMSSNPTTIFETTVVMQDKSSASVVDWEWLAVGAAPGYSYSQNPTFKYPEGVTGSYPIQLIVTTEQNCIDTVTNILTINSDILFYAPTAFTPDGDEHNQTWKFYVQGIDEYAFELIIFNRWGEIIWETHDPNSSWDGTYNGKKVPSGAYPWKASAKDTYTDGKKEFQGIINLL